MRILFDPLALWNSLDAPTQARMGALAIAYEVAAQGAQADSFDEANVFENTADTAISEFQDLLAEHLPEAFEDNGNPRHPDLNTVGIRQCTTCGCTEDHACKGGCSWIAETTRSRCLPPKLAA